MGPERTSPKRAVRSTPVRELPNLAERNLSRRPRNPIRLSDATCQYPLLLAPCLLQRQQKSRRALFLVAFGRGLPVHV
jgi:hypothetical protein